MTERQLRALIKHAAPLLVEKLGLQHWRIECVYDTGGQEGKEGGGFASTARTHVDTTYQQAGITFYYPELIDQAHALKTLRHELIHVVLAPFEMFVGLAREHWAGDEVRERVMGELETHTIERMVWALERVLDQIDPWENYLPTKHRSKP